MSSRLGDITKILWDLKHGDRSAEGVLVPLVYQELRRIARAHLRKENATHSLQPTALVHEAYLKLVALNEMDWQSRAHFFAVSSTLMRRILVDHARAARADKRGGGESNLSFEEALFPAGAPGREILELNDALDRLAELDERHARIIEMRFFAGMTEEETAEALGVSSRTVKRDWRLAKAWLFRELSC